MISAALMVLASLLSSAPQPAPADLCGVVRDQTGAAVAGASLDLLAGKIHLTAATDAAGAFCFHQLEPGSYQLTTQARGFQPDSRKITLAPGESRRFTISLAVKSVAQQVTVAEGTADTSSLNVAETKIDRGLIENLPRESVNASLSSILALATPGVAADSNGVFHPLGEHAETSFSLDGQPISDQQSRIFSNQISASALQEMRTLQGAPPAEFGDKTSLIVEATTRSGLNAGPLAGDLTLGYGSFHTPAATLTFAAGSKTLGNFVALDGLGSRRFLDAPEFDPLHARGNAENFFDRFDWQPSPATSFHVNLTAARSWFQVPDTYDQQAAGQDQRQHMTSFNFALAFSRLLSPSLLLTANAWVRQDRVEYFPSASLFSDQPATLAQSRRLTSAGFRSDLAYTHGRHAWKGGVQFQATPLSEFFTSGLTDPAFNSPCLGPGGVPVPDPALTAPSQCAAAGYVQNASFQPALLPYDLTRGGALFSFRGAATIYEASAYVQDSISLGPLTLNLGLRYDAYHGLSRGYGIQPRTGLAYRLRSTGTVLHFSYARIFLTPYNENLIVSSSTGPGGLGNGSLGATAVRPLTPARRNQYNAGLEQQFGRRFTIQAEYFWKYTHGAYDFNTILNTPLNFPIQFRLSKIDGALVRATLANFHGLSAFAVLGHTRSRLFSPEVGGINFGTAYAPVARPDHDQAFQQTTNVQYQFPERSFRGLWLGLTWRFDSGLVVVNVPDYATALTLTGDEQQEMGLYCGTVFATDLQPLRSCNSAHYGATLIHIAPPGTYNPDTNPSRIAPHNLFDAAMGADHLWTRGRYGLGAKLSVVNLTDKVALYNFLSSFSGTHFITPRVVQGELTLHF
ncbi:MAG TPA: TonB-dependent receptor [Candidatus Acidoferrales bacterium]|nr:TonB-dependent receptor [Candidatus Acidoferrales bacterium]